MKTLKFLLVTAILLIATTVTFAANTATTASESQAVIVQTLGMSNNIVADATNVQGKEVDQAWKVNRLPYTVAMIQGQNQMPVSDVQWRSSYITK